MWSNVKLAMHDSFPACGCCNGVIRHKTWHSRSVGITRALPPRWAGKIGRDQNLIEQIVCLFNRTTARPSLFERVSFFLLLVSFFGILSIFICCGGGFSVGRPPEWPPVVSLRVSTPPVADFWKWREKIQPQGATTTSWERGRHRVSFLHFLFNLEKSYLLVEMLTYDYRPA